MNKLLPPRTSRFLRRQRVVDQAKAITLYIEDEEIDDIRVEAGDDLREVVEDMVVGLGEEFPGKHVSLTVHTRDGDPINHAFVIPHGPPGEQTSIAAQAARLMRTLTTAMESHLSRLERHNAVMMQSQVELTKELRTYARANAKIEAKREGRREEAARIERRDALFDKYGGMLFDRVDEIVLGGLAQHAKSADKAGESSAVSSMRDKYVRLKLKDFFERKTAERRAQILAMFNLASVEAIETITMAELRRKYETLDNNARDQLINMLEPADVSLMATIDESVGSAVGG